MLRSRGVSLLLVGLFLCVTACTTYTQIEVGEVADHGKVQVTTIDGAKHKFYEPAVEADSIRGRIKESARIGGDRWSDSVVVIPLENVAEIAVVGTDEVATVILIVVLFGGIAATAVAASNTCWTAFC
jgi:hypothetical protein